MKNLIVKILLCSVLVFAVLQSCKEEGLVGVRNDDGVPPGKLTEVEVKAVSGGAIISYKLPDDDDIMGAKATLVDKNGIERNFLSSIYTNELIIDGLVDYEETKVLVYAIDKGGNQSEPNSVSFTPLLAPVDYAAESTKIEPTFGGCQVTFDNPSGSSLNMFLFVREWDPETGVDSTTLLNTYAYTSEEVKPVKERGFDTNEKEFFLMFKDRWNNFSDTIKEIIEPIYEIQIPYKNFKRHRLPHDVPIFGGNMEGDDPSHGLWNDVFGWDGEVSYTHVKGFRTLDGAGSNAYDPDPLPEFQDPFDPTRVTAQLFTLDLGAVCQLSRFTYHPLHSGYFALGGWRIFEVYGSTDPDPDGSMDGWFKLLDRTEVETPENHQERKNEIITQGLNFDFLTSQEVRYVRFAFYANYTTLLSFNASEIAFYGSVVEEVEEEEEEEVKVEN
ncbi:MAG: DUF4959 domain-containing protein [Carboxylicivirga sp.]|jgi:hypothetical protein|nr:DUF4959 domain-containing protein [Carboxylicivirga sp.]